MTFYFHTLGCKVNQYESQVMREILLNNGFTSCENSNADIIIINSCTVTSESDRKTRQTVRRFRKNNPFSIIVVTGCMTQACPETAKNIPEADIIIGNKNINNISEYINNYISSKDKITKIIPHEKGDPYSTPLISNFDERTRAFIKIEDGCERYCTYCIIPTARGRVRSKPIQQLKQEVASLVKKGYCEIVLVGINLSAYGKDTGLNLCDAVDAVCEFDEIKRVRLGSLEPDHISDELLSRLAANKKFCPQFHLSLQSGCDETLKRMNRHYDSDFYMDLVTRIRNKFNNPSITTDIMVGFAGETNQEFEKSLSFAKKVCFAKTHVFAYSRRKGTIADKLPNQIENSEKEKRSNIMIEQMSLCEKSFLETQLKKESEVLFETFENGYAYGYTQNYCRVKLKCNALPKENLLKVQLLELCDDSTILAKLI